jgi:sn-1 stearoyl-lipid 9-desaturase
MSFIDQVLQQPSYGWEDANGELIQPSKKQIVREMFSRMNIFASIKNWSAFIGWFWVLCLIPFVVVFITFYFKWYFVVASLLYGMIFMSTHGTIWYHRYSTHRAFKFKNSFWRFLTQNLVVKLIPEEIYVVSHHVHHSKSDKPGDPYNAQGGFLYCFLADTNHQPISKDMTEEEYIRTTKFLTHTGIYINSYKQYKKWGSVGHPLPTAIHWLLNWAFWYTTFYLIGGHGLACALFTGSLLWVLAVRTFNYQGHGRGKDMRRDGVDYNRRDMSINQSRPGLLGGEWHNNHHLYPNSARAGFLPGQWDNAWAYIYLLYKIGGVESYRDSKAQFLEDYYRPNKLAVNAKEDAKKADAIAREAAREAAKEPA